MNRHSESTGVFSRRGLLKTGTGLVVAGSPMLVLPRKSAAAVSIPPSINQAVQSGSLNHYNSCATGGLSSTQICNANQVAIFNALNTYIQQGILSPIATQAGSLAFPGWNESQVVELCSQAGFSLPSGFYSIYNSYPAPTVADLQRTAAPNVAQGYLTTQSNEYFGHWSIWLQTNGGNTAIVNPQDVGFIYPHPDQGKGGLGGGPCQPAWNQAQLQTLMTGAVGLLGLGITISVQAATLAAILGVTVATVAAMGGCIVVIGLMFGAFAIGATVGNMARGGLCP